MNKNNYRKLLEFNQVTNGGSENKEEWRRK